MTEKPEIAEAGVEAVSGIDPAAIGLALAAASRDRADTFLEEQTRLVRLQAEELSHELDVRRWSLWVRHLSGLLKLTFEIGLAMVALGVACFIAAAVWNAAHAEGLVIESFSVPPSLVEKGLTGQVVASRLQERLSWIANVTASVRPPASYANNWDNDLKVEIPETGISIGEAYRFLRSWLGHETYLSGDIVSTASGIVLSIHTTGGVTASIAGTEDRLDDMVLKTAENIFRQTEAGRYARYLFIPRPGSPQRIAEANAILLWDIANKTDPYEKAWSWNAIGSLNSYLLDYRAAAAVIRNGLALNLEMTSAYVNLALIEIQLSHPEAALAAAKTAQKLFERNPVPEIRASSVGRSAGQNQIQLALLQGGFDAPAAMKSEANVIPNSSFAELVLDLGADVLARRHDEGDAHAFWRDKPAALFEPDKARRALSVMQIEAGLGHWQAVVAAAPAAEKAFAALHVANPATVRAIQFRPMLARAKAELGDIAGAQALIAATPDDCYDCIRTRALIAEAAKQPGRADYWFTRAVAAAPSIPFAYSDWGEALLARDDADGAIAKFVLANQRGPHFADPLEGWGEALMAKSQSHLALAKFAAANQYAPNWGRLHLKWGEALFYAGKKTEAQKQFARAAQLDLTPSEKSELARFNRV